MNWEETVIEEENRKKESEERRVKSKPTTSSHLLNIKIEAPVIFLPHRERENYQENGV